jgi:phage-related protein
MAISPNQEWRVAWIGSSLKDIHKLPIAVQRTFGTFLSLLARGIEPPPEFDKKQFKGRFKKTFEVRTTSLGEAYRLVYTKRYVGNIFVLHVFHKKSHSGSQTPREDIHRIEVRQVVVDTEMR